MNDYTYTKKTLYNSDDYDKYLNYFNDYFKNNHLCQLHKSYMTDFKTFISNNSDVIFRVWEKGRENEETCRFVLINEAIELPDGDILLALLDMQCPLSEDCPNDDNLTYIEYRKLSELIIDYSSNDQ